MIFRMNMDNKASITLPEGTFLQGGKYRIERAIGQGGFGITYLAEQTGLGMRVAIKEFFLKGSCTRDATTSLVTVPVSENIEIVEKCKKKFISEAKKISSFNNDHIVSIIDLFDENGTSYYVMKYLEGGSVASRLKRAKYDEAEALDLVRQIADALDTIHSHGLLHLDVKPANILFDSIGRAVLIDFGVSKYIDSDGHDTSTTSSLIGFSKGFAPIEQIGAMLDALSPATDIYSLGATLYNLVTGIVPPDASIINDTEIDVIPAKISPETENAIKQAMKPKRRERPQSISAFLGLLPKADDEVEEEETVVVNVLPEKKEFTKKTPFPIISLAILAVSLVFFAVSLFRRPILPPVVVDDTELTELRKKNQEYENKQLEDERTISSLQKEVSSLKAKNPSLQKISKELEDEKVKNNNLENDKKALNKEVQSLKAKNQTLQSNLTNSQEETERAKKEASVWKKRYEDLKNN